MKIVQTYFLIFFAIILLESCKTVRVKESNMNASIQESMSKAIKWQELNPIFAKSPTDWTNGAYYLGVVKAHQSTQENDYLVVLESMATRNEWKPWERFYHADDMNICYSYLYLNSIDPLKANLIPTDKFIKDHLYKPHPWKNGLSGVNLQGKNEPEEKNTMWWWCDALFMAPPVITRYAKQMNDESFLKEMDKYYLESYELLYDKKQHLFSRDSRFLWKGIDSDIKEKNGNKVFWSRGNGWVIAGLALVLNDLPKNYPNRIFYEKLFLEMSERIKNLQPEDGLWRTSLLSPESYAHGEVSGSGFFTFALAWGINHGLLKKSEYKPVVIKAWEAIAACQQESGKVGWVQNIGANPVPVSSDSWQNFGTGAFLMAGSEILKLNGN